MRRFKRGQSTAEYAIVIGLVIAAAVAMQVYVKRGIQGKMKAATDYRDTNDTTGTTKQYEPYYATTDNMVSERTTNERVQASGTGVITKTTTSDTSSRTGLTGVTGVQ